ncbi:MAG: cytochrome c3 family protein [bacterium]|nr:cytochrome c3 family protein [bacterium]
MKLNRWLSYFICGLSFIFFIPGLASSTDEGYVGIEKCKKCHVKIFKVWEKSAHANVQKAGKLEGKKIECETCHGPGEKHSSGKKKGTINKDPKCNDCHDVHGLKQGKKEKTEKEK